jgi:hypothetical protein
MLSTLAATYVKTADVMHRTGDMPPDTTECTRSQANGQTIAGVSLTLTPTLTLRPQQTPGLAKVYRLSVSSVPR